MTPDLQTEIRFDELTYERAKEISEASKDLSDGFHLWSARQLRLFRREPFLVIPELHDYLTEAADWDAETWDFEPDGCARLVRTLSWLYERVPEPFIFSATWGPVTIDDRDIDRATLLAVIESNAVGTATVYKVRPA